MTNKTKYIIRTPYGDKYEVTREGYVIKHSNGLDKTNSGLAEIKTWQVLGIHEIKPFNQLGRLIPLSEAVNITEWHFKNGNPRYTASDIDHGTRGVWGNWNYHGIKSICLENNN